MRNCILIILLLSGTAILAQEKYFYIALDVNKPLSNTSWVGDVSSCGLSLGYHVFLNPRLSVGLDVGAGAFDQYHPTEISQTTNGAITTDYFKYIYTYSIAASARYYFPLGDQQRFFPYGGLGLGANNNEYVIYYNIYQDAVRDWGFLARPEAGIMVRFGSRRSLGARAAVHYDYSTNKTARFGYDNFSTLGFQIGLIMLEF